MMKAVLKTLAISFGGGLALGAGIRLTQGPARSRRQPPVDLDPLLARIQNVESRIVEMEAEPHLQHAPAAETTLAAFESRLADQLEDVEQVRDGLKHVERRLGEVDAQIPAVVQSNVNLRFREVESRLQRDYEEAHSRSMAAFVETLESKVVEIPALVQSTVDVRFREVQSKLQQDFEEAQNRSMAAFVDTLQSKVVNRINTLETNLSEQSQVIGKLRDSSVRTDESLQKMLVGIERLVEQGRVPQTPSEAPPVSPAPPPQPVAAKPVEPLREDAGHPEKLAAHLAQVRQEVVNPQLEERLPEPPPVLVSEARATPAPVIGHPAAVVEVPSNGKPAAEPFVDEVPVAEAVTTNESAGESEESFEWVNRIGLELLAPQPKPRFGWRLPLAVGLVVGLILIAGLLYTGVLQRFISSSAVQQTSTLASTAPEADSQASPNTPRSGESAVSSATAASLVAQGRDYTRHHDWAQAEAAFRSALQASPANRDAALGLSDVLYQEQKYEESAAVLNKLSSASPSQ